jgi:phosphatidylserine decarboxylase
MHWLRRTSSALVGWLADRRIPGPLRGPLYGAYCRATGAEASEAQLEPRAYPSLGAFFVRRLRAGARPLDPDELTFGSPCDGRVQTQGRIDSGRLLQAKGRDYPVEELLGGPAAFDLDGAWAWTLYLSPRDYHRVHVPTAARLEDVRWIPGHRFSVAPTELARRPRVLSVNERAVLTLRSPVFPFHMVMVGALNVGRIRVVGVEPGTAPTAPISLARGDELARFEMGSTVVLIAPPDALDPVPLDDHAPVRLNQRLGVLHP